MNLQMMTVSSLILSILVTSFLTLYFFYVAPEVKPFTPGSKAYIYQRETDQDSDDGSLVDDFWGLDIHDDMDDEEEDEFDVHDEEEGDEEEDEAGVQEDKDALCK